ncbi:MAG: DJ-1/PfpI family protein [Ktedonobacterales bacterium]
MRIDIVIFDGFDEIDALAPYEFLKRAQELGAPFDVRLVTIAPTDEVTASYGLRVRPDAVLDAAHPADILLVPGGGWNHRGERGARIEAERGTIPAALAPAHQAGAILAGVCTGGMLIATTGLLHGRPATTHHLARAALQDLGASVVNARVVDDGDIITASGVTSGLDLASWLTERFAGAAIAQAVEERIEYERRGTVWRKDEHAPGYTHPTC